MSRSATAMDPGKTNRRFVMLALVLGLIGAGLVYIAFSREEATTTGGARPTNQVAVVVAKTDIPARARIIASMIEVRFVPQDAAGLDSFATTDEVLGRITRFPIAANEQILPTKIVTVGTGSTPAAAASRALSYTIPPNMRGFAIGASTVMNAGGLVLPGDYIDILVMYDVEFTNDESEENYFVQTILQNVEVLAVSQIVVDHVLEATPSAGGQRPRNSEAGPQPEASTVTLALTPEQAQRMYLAEGNGELRFAVRPYGESAEHPIEFLTENDLYPRNLPNPFTR